MPEGVIFTIFDFEVRWYGVMIMLGVLVACFVSYYEARRRGEDPERVWQLLPWVLVFGIAGARLGWVIAEAPSSGQPFWELIFDMSGGFGLRGLSIQGAIVGGVIAVLIFCRRQNASFLT